MFFATFSAMLILVTSNVAPFQVTVLPEESTFLSHDLHLLESFEFKQRIEHISEIFDDLKWENVDPDSLTRFSSFYCLFLFCYSDLYSLQSI